MWISSVTKKAIQEGFKQLKNGNAYQNLYEAALARSEADWIVGINATRALTTKYDAQLSLGRVQTPTIQIVKSRQDEINYFKPEKYYTLSINVDGYDLNLKQQKRYKDKKELELIEHKIKHQEGKILEVKGKNKKSYAQIQERLRAILATDYKSHVRDLISESFSSKMHIFNNQKVSDHHAIIPTEVRPSIEQLSQREFKIYMLIAERFLENLMNPYLYEVLTIHAQLKDYNFVLKEIIPKQLGYKALKDQTSSHTLTHSFKEGQLFKVHRIEIHEHETKAPEYFNEGSLLKAMENPQNHIDLNDKKYALESRDGKIKVTSKGKQILELSPSELTSPILTAQWEEKLMLIEKGKYNSQKFIQEMKNFTFKVVNKIKSSEQKYKHDNLTTTECPTCGKFMIKVKTKNGQMLVCQDPKCKTKKNIQRKTNARCPNCKKKMTLFGKGKEAVYRCVCGHTETQSQMDKRMRDKTNGKVSRKEMKKYINKKEEIDNNPFKDALKNLKL